MEERQLLSVSGGRDCLLFFLLFPDWHPKQKGPPRRFLMISSTFFFFFSIFVEEIVFVFVIRKTNLPLLDGGF